MVIVRALVFMISASFASIAFAGDDFLQSLTEEKARLMSALSEAGISVIYSEAVREDEYSYIERNLTHRAEYEAQFALWAAAKDFIEFLESTSGQYYDLPYSQWLLAADALLAVDALLQDDIGWGNLVVKVCIYNKLYYWMFDYIDTTRDIDKEKLAQLMAMLGKLRRHMPSREAMTYLALRYYGHDGYRKPSDFGLTTPVSKEADVLQENVYAYFGGKDEAARAVGEMIGKESGKEVDGYVDLFENPLPWFAAQSGLFYTEFSWALYLALSLMYEHQVVFGQMEAVTSEQLNSVLEKAYNNENRFWMTRAAVDSVEKPEVYSNEYLKSVRSGRVINELVRRHRQLAGDAEPVAWRRFSLTKLD